MTAGGATDWKASHCCSGSSSWARSACSLACASSNSSTSIRARLSSSIQGLQSGLDDLQRLLWIEPELGGASCDVDVQVDALAATVVVGSTPLQPPRRRLPGAFPGNLGDVCHVAHLGVG